MKKNKLFSLLENISEEEMRKFGIFLASPYHNTNKTLSKFHLYLEKIYPDFPENKITKQAIHNKFFKDKEFTSRRITDLFSDLSLLLEDFLVYEELNENKIEKKIFFVRSLGKRNAHPFFERETEKGENLLKAIDKKDGEVYLKLHKLNANLYFHINTPKRKAKEHLEEANYYLDAFFTIRKLRYSYELKHLDKDHKALLYQEEAITNSDFFKEESHVFQLLVLLPSLKKGDSKEAFDKTHFLFIKYLKVIPKEIKETIFVSLLNYVIRNMSSNSEKDNILFKLYNIGIKEEIVIENGQMSSNLFFNITTKAFNLGKFNWVENFIKDYSQFLDTKIKKNLILLIKAFSSFYRKKFEESNTFLDKIEYKKFSFRYIAELLTIRSSYEIFLKKNTYSEILRYKIEAQRKYYYRNNIISNLQKESMLNFLNFMFQIVSASENPNFTLSKKKELKEKILQTKELKLKSYLLEKVNELKIGRQV